jgi:hypothetical protein
MSTILVSVLPSPYTFVNSHTGRNIITGSPSYHTLSLILTSINHQKTRTWIDVDLQLFALHMSKDTIDPPASARTKSQASNLKTTTVCKNWNTEGCPWLSAGESNPVPSTIFTSVLLIDKGSFYFNQFFHIPNSILLIHP